MRWILILLIISGLTLTIYPSEWIGNNRAIESDFQQFQANADRTLGRGALDQIPNYGESTLPFKDILQELDDSRASSFPQYIGLIVVGLSIYGLVLEIKKSKKQG